MLKILAWITDWSGFINYFVAKDAGFFHWRKRDLKELPTYYPFDVQTYVEASSQKTGVVLIDIENQPNVGLAR